MTLSGRSLEEPVPYTLKANRVHSFTQGNWITTQIGCSENTWDLFSLILLSDTQTCTGLLDFYLSLKLFMYISWLTCKCRSVSLELRVFLWGSRQRTVHRPVEGLFEQITVQITYFSGKKTWFLTKLLTVWTWDPIFILLNSYSYLFKILF